VSGGNALAVVLSVAAGLAGSTQAAVMGRLGQRVGIFEAVVLSSIVVVAVSFAALFVARQGVGALSSAFWQPWWLWTGGLLSAFIVLTVTLASPRLGVAATVGLVITGNLVMSAAIDRFGLFGFDQIALHWPRVLGIVLLAAGAALSLRK
jgi:bacterial/archaeal transporter family-2 protein